MSLSAGGVAVVVAWVAGGWFLFELSFLLLFLFVCCVFFGYVYILTVFMAYAEVCVGGAA